MQREMLLEHSNMKLKLDSVCEGFLGGRRVLSGFLGEFSLLPPFSPTPKNPVGLFGMCTGVSAPISTLFMFLIIIFDMFSLCIFLVTPC